VKFKVLLSITVAIDRNTNACLKLMHLSAATIRCVCYCCNHFKRLLKYNLP